MIGAMRRPDRKLPDETYIELVNLLYTALPQITSLCIGMTVGLGILAYSSGEPLYLLLLVFAAAAGAIRIALVLYFPRERGCRTVQEARKWELRYGFGSIAVALEIAALSVIAFSFDDPGAHLLAMGLTLALCAGHASRVAVRPWIALGAGTLVIFGFAASATMHHDLMYRVVGYLAIIYLFSYYETVLKYYGVLVDRLLAKREIEHLATHDPLTSLANRRAVQQHLDIADRHWEIDGRAFAVVCLDLDGFKEVNDRFGHGMGDELLCAVADRLRGTLREDDICGRLGGDEFAIIRKNLRTPLDLDILAESVIAELSKGYVLRGRPVSIGVSIGVAIASSALDGSEAMMVEADRALYRAKRAGKGCYRIAGRENVARIRAPQEREAETPPLQVGAVGV
jgi:diguanylate cyclase (GGDEF)-like protein